MIGAKIKEYRIINDMKQSDLAKRLHVAQATVSSWEIGRTEPNMGMIEQLAQIFDCQKSDLLGEHSEPTTDCFYDLSFEEKALIECYHHADNQKRAEVRQLLRLDTYIRRLLDANPDENR